MRVGGMVLFTFFFGRIASPEIGLDSNRGMSLSGRSASA